MNEKDEKFDEKALEKQDEKSTEEKNWDEKWRRDPLSAIVWAVILIWAGVVFLLSNLGMLDWLIGMGRDITGWGSLQRFGEAWSVVLLGAGGILLIEVAVRLLVPVYRRPVTGTVIFAVILIAAGLGDLINNWTVVWAVILIFLGISILVRGLRRNP